MTHLVARRIAFLDAWTEYKTPNNPACRLKWFHLRIFSHFPGMIWRICLFTKFIDHIIPFFLLPKNGEVSGEMTKPNSLGLHWPSRDRPDPCWTGTMSQPKMHPPLSVRLIYGFCKKDNWEVRFTKGKEFWHWFLLRVSKMILNDLNRNLEPCM